MRWASSVFFILLGPYLTGCTLDVQVNDTAKNSSIPSGDSIITQPISIVLSGISSPSTESQPTFKVDGVQIGDTVGIYTDSACSAGAFKGSTIAVSTSAFVQSAPLSEGDYIFYVEVYNSVGNSKGCHQFGAPYSMDITAPLLSGLLDDSIKKKSKSWLLNCNDVGSSNICSYRTAIDSFSSISDSTSWSSYSSNSSISINTGTGIFFIHIQARDSAGNESNIVLPGNSGGTFSFLLDNSQAPPTAISLVLPAATAGTLASPTIRISGVSNGDTVKVFTDNVCTEPTALVATGVASSSDIDLISNSLSLGSYSFYATSTDSLGNDSTCSLVSASYTVVNNPWLLPLNPSVFTSGGIAFSGMGGLPPYSFSVLGGGAGGIINSFSGAYVAPGTTGSDVIVVTDAIGNTASTTISINTPFLLNSMTLLTGESFSFVPIGGVPPYLFSDSGTGFMNGGSGLYTVPLGIGATSETLTVEDSTSNTTTTQVKIRAFELKDSFNLSSNVVFDNSIANQAAEDTLGNLYVVGYGTDIDYKTTWIVRKSSDGGLNWNTVDEYQFFLGGSSWATTIAVDASNAIYVAGEVSNSFGNSHWIVRKSINGGSTWATIDTYNLYSSENAMPASMLIDTSNIIYVVGKAYDSSATHNWIVRKSSNGGLSWTTIDTFQLAGGWTAMASDIAIDSLGRLYVVGYGTVSPWVPHWIVRRSIDNGLTWSTVSDFQLESGQFADAVSVEIDSTNSVFVSGNGVSAGTRKWIVRKSSDAGSSWATVDTFQKSAGYASEPKDILVSENGALFVIGFGKDSSGLEHWIVRSSSNNGATWATTYDFNLTVGQHSKGNGLLQLQNGNIISVGQAAGSNGKIQWVVKRSANGGTTWTDSEIFNYVFGANAMASASATDTSNYLYTVGSAQDIDGNEHWIVRKSTDAGLTWTTVDNFQLSPGVSSNATAIAIDSSGAIFVVGRATDAAWDTRWLVRKSTNGGATWSTVQNYFPNGGRSATASGIFIDGSNNIYVAGSRLDGGWVSHWVVQKSTNGGSSWSVIDNFQLAAGHGALANAIMIDDSNNIFVVGLGMDAGSIQHAIIRKSINGGVSWTSIDNFNYSANYDSSYTALTRDYLGNIYVSGFGVDSSNAFYPTNLIVRKSVNSGATWTTVDSFRHISSKSATAFGIAAASDGSIFSGGFAFDSSGRYTSIVRISRNQGISWTTVYFNREVFADQPTIYGVNTCLSDRICILGNATPTNKMRTSYDVRILSSH